VNCTSILLERLPARPYCADDFHNVVIRGKTQARKMRYFQANHPGLHLLAVDIDRPFDPADLDHANIPWPSIVTHTPHGWHGLWMLKKPIPDRSVRAMRWASDIQRGIRRRLGGDPGFSGFLIRNPVRHDHVDTGRLFSLQELDRFLDPVDKMREQEVEVGDGFGRNCTMFNEVRLWAYRHVGDFADFESWHSAVLERCIAAWVAVGGHAERDPYHTAKSIAKWVWARRGELVNRKVVQRGRYGCSREEAGRVTAALKATKSDAAIRAAIEVLRVGGKRLSATAIAVEAGVSRRTVYRFFERHGRP